AGLQPDDGHTLRYQHKDMASWTRSGEVRWRWRHMSAKRSEPTTRVGYGHALAMLLVGVFAMAWASILIRWTAAPALVIGAGRLTAATIILAPFAWRRAPEEWRRLSRRQWLLLAVSGVALGLHFAAWIASLER